MGERHEEWVKQADYDMDTADAMFTRGRYFYPVYLVPERKLRNENEHNINHEVLVNWSCFH
jgi:hypothetical protein